MAETRETPPIHWRAESSEAMSGGGMDGERAEKSFGLTPMKVLCCRCYSCVLGGNHNTKCGRGKEPERRLLGQTLSERTLGKIPLLHLNFLCGSRCLPLARGYAGRGLGNDNNNNPPIAFISWVKRSEAQNPS